MSGHFTAINEDKGKGADFGDTSSGDSIPSDPPLTYRCVDSKDEAHLPPCLDSVDFQVILPQHDLPSGITQQLADALTTARDNTTTAEPFTDWRVGPDGLFLLRRLPLNSRNHWQAVIGQALGRYDVEGDTCCKRCETRPETCAFSTCRVVGLWNESGGAVVAMGSCMNCLLSGEASQCSLRVDHPVWALDYLRACCEKFSYAVGKALRPGVKRTRAVVLSEAEEADDTPPPVPEKDTFARPLPRRGTRRQLATSSRSTTDGIRKSLSKLGFPRPKKTRGSASTSDALALAETANLIPTPSGERYNSVLTDNLRSAQDPQTFAVVADRLCTRRMELREDVRRIQEDLDLLEVVWAEARRRLFSPTSGASAGWKNVASEAEDEMEL
jgi:hypothetical protein